MIGLVWMGWLIGCPAAQEDPKEKELVDPPYVEGEPLLAFHGPPPKNLLFLSIDTIRKDQLPPYGGDKTVGPFFNELWENSTTLDHHMQCSNWTFHSTSCTLGGRYAEENGFLPRLLSEEGRTPMPPDQQTIATVLSGAGYNTTLVATNAWLSGAETVNNAQGYAQEPKGPGPARNLASLGIKAAKEQGTDDPWFLHVHFMEPHAPYVAPMEFRVGEGELPALPDSYDLDSQDKHYRSVAGWSAADAEEQALLEDHLWTRYQGEIRWLDSQFSEIWGNLLVSGMLEDTLVVVWNDHGEQMFEHGQQTHAWGLYGEENDAFVWFWAENLVPRHFDGPTSGIDVLPTVLDALDVPIPEPERVMGEVAGTAAPDRTIYLSSYSRIGPAMAAVKNDQKLLYAWFGAAQLYDRSIDPLETNDLFEADHPTVTDLWPALQERVLLSQEVQHITEPTWPAGLEPAE